MPIVKASKRVAATVERFFVYRVLSLDDTPHRIALGVAIGIFVTWTPTIGLQMVLTVALAALLRANKLVGVPFVWLSNPATIMPIYVPNYYLGCWLLNKPADSVDVIKKAINFSGGWADRTQAWAEAVMKIFTELWLGSVIMGLVLGIVTYFVIYFLVVNYRKGLHAWQEHHHKGHPGDEQTPDAQADEDVNTDDTQTQQDVPGDEQQSGQTDNQQDSPDQEPEKVS